MNTSTTTHLQRGREQKKIPNFVSRQPIEICSTAILSCAAGSNIYEKNQWKSIN